jgi:hypothetical protein
MCGQDSVEAGWRIWNSISCPLDDLGSTRRDEPSIAPSGLSHHCTRSVEAHHTPRHESFGHALNGISGTAPDVQDLGIRRDVRKLHGKVIGHCRLGAHDVAKKPADDAAGPGRLARDPFRPTASGRFDFSRPPHERGAKAHDVRQPGPEDGRGKPDGQLVHARDPVSRHHDAVGGHERWDDVADEWKQIPECQAVGTPSPLGT